MRLPKVGPRLVVYLVIISALVAVIHPFFRLLSTFLLRSLHEVVEIIPVFVLVALSASKQSSAFLLSRLVLLELFFLVRLSGALVVFVLILIFRIPALHRKHNGQN